MLLWDRGLYSFEMVVATLRRGCGLLGRLPATVRPEVSRTLADITSLVWLRPSERKRRKHGERVLVRLVRYTMDDPNRPGHRVEHRLITSLMDPEAAPPEELVLAYHARWEFELAADEIKTHQRRAQRPLRSENPVGVVQEVYGLLVAHYVVRAVMADAAETVDLPPGRMSFIHTLRVLREAAPEIQRTAAEDHPRLYRQLLAEVAATPLPPRGNRSGLRAWTSLCNPAGEFASSIKGDYTPKDLLATAYWAYDAKLMAEMAQAIGREEDAATYAKLFEMIKVAFNDTYVAPDGRIQGDTQTAYVLALHMDLLPQELRPAAAEHLVAAVEREDWHLSTGFVRVGYLCPVLTEAGRADVAYRLLENETYPSWGYTIKNGATTIWERWDGWTKERGFQSPNMNSFNHYSLGAVGEWLYQCVAGIDLDPQYSGYEHIIIRPRPGGDLTWARGVYDSVRGRIVSAWQLGTQYGATPSKPEKRKRLRYAGNASPSKPLQRLTDHS